MLTQQVQGERKASSFKYQHLARVTAAGMQYSFPMDMLRYDRAWLMGTEDIEAATQLFTHDAKAGMTVTICALSETLRDSPFTSARWPSDWQVEPVGQSGKLPKPLWYQHYARIEPKSDWNGQFPLSLLTLEHASPYREGHANQIERILNALSGLYPVPEPRAFGLTKFGAKISDWRVDDWAAAGWDLEPITQRDFHRIPS